jgi:hypothetical protein
MVASVPISYKSSCCGSLILESFWVNMATNLSFSKALSAAETVEDLTKESKVSV